MWFIILYLATGEMTSNLPFRVPVDVSGDRSSGRLTAYSCLSHLVIHFPAETYVGNKLIGIHNHCLKSLLESVRVEFPLLPETNLLDFPRPFQYFFQLLSNFIFNTFPCTCDYWIIQTYYKNL